MEAEGQGSSGLNQAFVARQGSTGKVGEIGGQCFGEI